MTKIYFIFSRIFLFATIIVSDLFFQCFSSAISNKNHESDSRLHQLQKRPPPLISGNQHQHQQQVLSTQQHTAVPAVHHSHHVEESQNKVRQDTKNVYECNLPAQFPHISMKDNRIYLVDTDLFLNAQSVGNYLTLYYNTRGIAKFSKLCFASERNMSSDGWLMHLPQLVCPPPTNNFNNNMNILVNNMKDTVKLLDTICKSCSNNVEMYHYPHECKNFYLSEKVEMKNEIRNALTTYSKQQNITIPEHSNDTTSVIYSRCRAGDSFMGYKNYGPAGFSFYKPAVESSTHIVIVARVLDKICLEIRDELVMYMLALKPSLVITFQSLSAFQDYATIVFAKRVFADISTYAMTAGFARDGDIHMPSNTFMIDNKEFPHFKLSNVPILRPDIGHDLLGIQCKAPCREFNEKDSKNILNWLVTH